MGMANADTTGRDASYDFLRVLRGGASELKA